MDKAQVMFSLVDEYHNSGFSMRDFTASKGIKLSTFTYWVRKKKQTEDPSPSGSFIPLNFKQQKRNSESIEIVYPNGVRIVADYFNVQQVQQLVKIY